MFSSSKLGFESCARKYFLTPVVLLQRCLHVLDARRLHVLDARRLYVRTTVELTMPSIACQDNKMFDQCDRHIAMMNDIDSMRTHCEEALAQGRCAVCNKQCGAAAPRQATLAHMRAATDAAHVTWRMKYWDTLMRRGTKARRAATDEESIVEITRSWPPARVEQFARSLLA
jgi:hypothetical protein